MIQTKEGGIVWAANVPEGSPREIVLDLEPSPEDTLGELLDIYFGGGEEDAGNGTGDNLL